MGTQYVIVGGSHKQHHTYPTGNPSIAQVHKSDYRMSLVTVSCGLPTVLITTYCTMSLVYCERWSVDHLFMCMWCRILVVWPVVIRSWIIPILVQSSKFFNQTILLIHTLILSVYPGRSLDLCLVYCSWAGRVELLGEGEREGKGGGTCTYLENIKERNAGHQTEGHGFIQFTWFYDPGLVPVHLMHFIQRVKTR